MSVPGGGGGPTKKAARAIPTWKVAVATISAAVISVAILAALATKLLDFTDRIELGIATFLIGSFGAGVVVFGGMVGLKDFTNLPELLFTNMNVAMYVLVGGGIAVLFWLPAPLTFAPLYSAGIGAAWPAAIQGIVTSSQSKKIADDQIQPLKDLLSAIR